jgi:hypothetical protein
MVKGSIPSFFCLKNNKNKCREEFNPGGVAT